MCRVTLRVTGVGGRLIRCVDLFGHSLASFDDRDTVMMTMMVMLTWPVTGLGI